MIISVWRSTKKLRVNKVVSAATALIFLIAITSCNKGSEPLKVGIDNCHFCKMTISDVRFGAEVITKKGKIYKFDDTHCILNFLKTKEVGQANIKNIYFTNYSGNHQLINANTSFLLKADELRSPMGGNIAAFDNKDSLLTIQKHFSGSTVAWNDLLQP